MICMLQGSIAVDGDRGYRDRDGGGGKVRDRDGDRHGYFIDISV